MKNFIKFTTPFLIIFAILFTSDFLRAAWSAPTATPPLNNTPTPINVGPDVQTKGGLLGLAELLVSGNVTIGSAVPSAGLMLDVAGNIGATQYCDENGGNCFASSDISTSSASSQTVNTIVPGWPDAIYCVRTSDSQGRVYFPDYMPTSNRYYYRTPASGNSYISLVFNPDGSFNSETYGTTNCNGKSIYDLGNEGKAVSLGAVPFNGTPI